jgi:hypothetical protein
MIPLHIETAENIWGIAATMIYGIRLLSQTPVVNSGTTYPH